MVWIKRKSRLGKAEEIGKRRWWLMRKILESIDAANEWTGRATRWLVILIILAICGEVFMRFVLNYPTVQGPVIATMSGAAFYALSWGYIHLYRRRVTVDVFYARFSARGKAAIDVVCGVLAFAATDDFDYLC